MIRTVMNRQVGRRPRPRRNLAGTCLALALAMAWLATPSTAQPDPRNDTAAPASAPSPVAGKKICIDPGHGGGESGAVGPTGLKEKDLNLAVALMLRDLLQKAGATVVMTRDTDKTVSIGERGRLNRAEKTDLFVSIHHNANAQNDPSSDRIEVFWHWHDDGGPSEDAARAALRPLQATFGQPGSKAYLCWAYGVLRETAYPAILGEAYYLSNAAQEEKAKTDAYRRAEAEAYFQGIEAYFQGGRPEIALVPTSDPAATRVVQAAVFQRDNLSILDPQRIRAELDGVPIPSYLFYRANLGLLFGILPRGDISATHTLTLAARNLAGHTSFVKKQPIGFENPWTPPKPPHQARVGQAKILGVRTPGAPPVPLPGAELFGQQIRAMYALAGADGSVRLDAAERLMPEPHVARASGFWTREVDLTHEKEIVLQPMFRGVLHGKKIVVDAEGGGDVAVAIGPKGLRASDANLETALYLTEYLRDAGARVDLTRETDRGMDNVSRVRFGLEREPDIFLTVGHRMPEPGMNEKPKMLVSRIGSRWDGGREIGKHMIYHLRQLLGTGADLGNPASRDPLPTEVHNWSSWEVMHAAQNYTAVYVCPMMFDGPGVEARLSTTAGARKEALAMLYGLLDFHGLDDREMSGVAGSVVDQATGRPVGDALVWLDNTLVAQTEADGAFLFKFLEPGAHTIRAMAAGYTLLTVPVDLKEKELKPARLELRSGQMLPNGNRE